MIIWSILGAVFVCSLQRLEVVGELLRDGDQIQLINDMDRTMFVCSGCLTTAEKDLYTFNLAFATDQGETWTVQSVPRQSSNYVINDGQPPPPPQKISLRSATKGNFLSRCNTCIRDASYPDAAFVHVKDQGPNEEPPSYSTWTQYDLGNGKIALQADTGRYLCRCNGCAPGYTGFNDFPFVHGTEADKQMAYCQWKVRMIRAAPTPAPPPAPAPAPESRHRHRHHRHRKGGGGRRVDSDSKDRDSSRRGGNKHGNHNHNKGNDKKNGNNNNGNDNKNGNNNKGNSGNGAY